MSGEGFDNTRCTTHGTVVWSEELGCIGHKQERNSEGMLDHITWLEECPLGCPPILGHFPSPFSLLHPGMTHTFHLLKPAASFPTSPPALTLIRLSQRKKKGIARREGPSIPITPAPLPSPSPALTCLLQPFPPQQMAPLPPVCSESWSYPVASLLLISHFQASHPLAGPVGSSFRLYPHSVHFLSPPPAPPGSKPPSSFPYSLSLWLSRASPCFLFSPPATGFQHSSHRAPHAISFLCANGAWLLSHGE